MMKICFCAENRGPFDLLHEYTTTSGGAEKQIVCLMKALATAGHEVYLFYGGGRQLDAHERGPYGITCIPLSPRWQHPGSLLAFWHQLDQIRPDIIYARLPSDFLWVLGLFARTRRPTRFVYALANDRFCAPWQSYDYNAWFHNPLYALGLAMADVVLIQHEAQRSRVQRFTKGRVSHLPNLVAPIAQKARDAAATEFDAIWVAQVRPSKQLPIYLDLVERLPQLRFAMVGALDHSIDLRTQQALRARIKRLSNLDYRGLQPATATRRFIERSKVLVNTSATEGFPNTMLEAWSMGVPVVSLTIDPGGVIAQHRLGAVSGTPDRLRKDVKRLVESCQLNHEFGANGLAYVYQHHSLALVRTMFEQLLIEDSINHVHPFVA